MVECESPQSHRIHQFREGFNRYMVECEYIARFRFFKRICRFNRYMVEGEYSLSKISFALSLVLIDTWWNVNMWNLVAGEDYSSFNRYMVECE